MGTLTRTKTHRPRAASAASTPVSSIMSRDVITVPSGTSIEGVAELMLARGLSRVPVVDRFGRLVGIVSKTDLVERTHQSGDTLEAPARPHPSHELPEDSSGFHVHAEGISVDEVMSRSVMATGETASIARAAELMSAAHVHGLPVVTSSGTLVGFVSSMDVLGWLAGIR